MWVSLAIIVINFGMNLASIHTFITHNHLRYSGKSQLTYRQTELVKPTGVLSFSLWPVGANKN